MSVSRLSGRWFLLLLSLTTMFVSRQSLFAATPTKSPKLMRLTISPTQATVAGARGKQGFRVTGEFADGTLRDVTSECEFRSMNPAVTEVAAGGIAQPKTNGGATIMAKWQDTEVAAQLTIQQIDDHAYNFRNDVLPVIEHLTCNQMGCHGSPKGKKRLQLSLFSADPHKDYLQLTDKDKKLIDPDNPSRSWMLLKAICEEDHGGSDLTSEGSAEYKLLLDWIKNGAPEGRDSDPEIVRVDVFPVERRMLPGEKHHLLVEAYYSDGTMRDVTDLASFKSDEEAVAKVVASGVVEGTGYGEAVIMVSYGGRLTASRVISSQPATVPFPKVATTSKVDELVLAKLHSLNIIPSDLCSDTEFLRRVHLDVTGALPTVEEARAFLSDSSPNKRQNLIDSLLDRPDFADFYALKWGDVFQINRNEPAQLQEKGMWAFYRWLWDAIDKNMPMDQFTREILTARGSAFRNGPVNFFRVGEGPQGMAEHAATAFLGVRLDCAHCHNHPFEQFTLVDNLGMAAFFTKVKIKRSAEDDEEIITLTETGSIKNPDTNQVASPKFLGGAEISAAEKAVAATAEAERVAAELAAKDAAAILKAAQDKDAIAAATTAKKVADQLLAEKTAAAKAAVAAVQAADNAGDLREKLADWITAPDNPYFARHMANRVWTWLLGRGIIDEPDDFRSTNPASNPDLLDHLAGEFVRSGYDMKALFRLVLNSRTYQLSSQPTEWNRHDKIYHSHAALKRLTAEQLATSISQATGVHEKYSNLPLGTRATQLPDVSMRSEFLDLFGRPKRATPVESERTCDTHLGQSLQMISSDYVARKLVDNSGRVAQLIVSNKSDSEVVDELYLATLSRFPTDAERQVVLAEPIAKENRRAMFEDLAWVLMNTKEFLFNH